MSNQIDYKKDKEYLCQSSIELYKLYKKNQEESEKIKTILKQRFKRIAEISLIEKIMDLIKDTNWKVESWEIFPFDHLYLCFTHPHFYKRMESDNGLYNWYEFLVLEELLENYAKENNLSITGWQSVNPTIWIEENQYFTKFKNIKL